MSSSSVRDVTVHMERRSAAASATATSEHGILLDTQPASCPRYTRLSYSMYAAQSLLLNRKALSSTQARVEKNIDTLFCAAFVSGDETVRMQYTHETSSQGPSPTVSCRCSRAKTELSDTAFRQVEKRYKLYQLGRREARRQSVPETDFTDLVNFHDLKHNTEANREGIHRVVVSNPDLVCHTFAGVPGLLIFPGVLDEKEQIHFCRDAILEYGDAQQHPNILSTHAKTPRSTTCYQPPMRWSTLGFSYEWTSKTYNKEKYSSFPADIKEKMETLISYVACVQQDEWQVANPASYQPQTAIVNYYPVGSMMMCHQDISEEVMDQPLVSLSLGCSAVFLMGTTSRDDTPYAFLLRSGDVAAFTGPARAAFHAVPRILDDCPAYLTIADGELTDEERATYVNHTYVRHPTQDGGFALVDKSTMTAEERERYWRLCMRHMRVNINARQVYDDDCAFLFRKAH